MFERQSTDFSRATPTEWYWENERALEKEGRWSTSPTIELVTQDEGYYKPPSQRI